MRSTMRRQGWKRRGVTKEREGEVSGRQDKGDMGGGDQQNGGREGVGRRGDK